MREASLRSLTCGPRAHTALVTARLQRVRCDAKQATQPLRPRHVWTSPPRVRDGTGRCRFRGTWRGSIGADAVCCLVGASMRRGRWARVLANEHANVRTQGGDDGVHRWFCFSAFFFLCSLFLVARGFVFSARFSDPVVKAPVFSGTFSAPQKSQDFATLFSSSLSARYQYSTTFPLNPMRGINQRSSITDIFYK